MWNKEEVCRCAKYQCAGYMFCQCLNMACHRSSCQWWQDVSCWMGAKVCLGCAEVQLYLIVLKTERKFEIQWDCHTVRSSAHVGSYLRREIKLDFAKSNAWDHHTLALLYHHTHGLQSLKHLAWCLLWSLICRRRNGIQKEPVHVPKFFSSFCNHFLMLKKQLSFSLGSFSMNDVEQLLEALIKLIWPILYMLQWVSNVRGHSWQVFRRKTPLS